jgi:phospholipid N-methyltransferase
MTAGVGIESARCVVELGPGTGAITREIVNRAAAVETFAAVELDAELCAGLREKFPTARFFNDSAANLAVLLEKDGLPRADIVLSGLPWAHFPERLQSGILESVRAALAPGGTFVTFAYCSGFLLPGSYSFRRQLRARFSQVRTSPWILKNIPPAFVYYAKI